jgi:hypothetical protein
MGKGRRGKKMANLTKEEEQERKNCICELNKLERKYNTRIFKAACYRKLIIDKQVTQRQKAIQKAEKELSQLKTGKPLPQY